jgi:hypothetical protein
MLGNIQHGRIWNLGHYTEIPFDSLIYLRMNVVMLPLNLLAFDQQPTPSTVARSIAVDPECHTPLFMHYYEDII